MTIEATIVTDDESEDYEKEWTEFFRGMYPMMGLCGRCHLVGVASLLCKRCLKTGKEQEMWVPSFGKNRYVCPFSLAKCFESGPWDMKDYDVVDQEGRKGDLRAWRLSSRQFFDLWKKGKLKGREPTFDAQMSYHALLKNSSWSPHRAIENMASCSAEDAAKLYLKGDDGSCAAHIVSMHMGKDWDLEPNWTLVIKEKMKRFRTQETEEENFNAWNSINVDWMCWSPKARQMDSIDRFWCEDVDTF